MTLHTMANHNRQTQCDAQDSAARAAQALAMALFASDDASDEIEVTLGGKTFTVPRSALMHLSTVLQMQAAGQDVILFPSEQLLTSQQAADVLNVSRPHLVKLLEDGKIPFTRVGTHRRVVAADVLAYKSRLYKERSAILDAITQEGQELGLYD